jgi:hypothetical protein
LSNIAKRIGHDTVDVEWHYFGSCHGKNASDGESGVLKTKMARLIIGNQIFVDSASEFAASASDHLSNPSGTSRRRFYFIPSNIISEFRSTQGKPKPIKGSRGIHFMKILSLGQLAHTTASCFCVGCRADGPCPYGVPSMTKVIVFKGIDESSPFGMFALAMINFHLS